MQPRSWPSVRAVIIIIIRTNWVLWFSQTQRCSVNISHRGKNTLTPAPRYPLLSAGRWIWEQILLDVDMWEDGTDHVLHPWCLHVWWDHRRGAAKRWQTLLVPLLDILKVMYIKAELFWLGRCQHTFIWLFLRGTTFESSTCDYSDDLQILLESGGRKQKGIKWRIPNRKTL